MYKHRREIGREMRNVTEDIVREAVLASKRNDSRIENDQGSKAEEGKGKDNEKSNVKKVVSKKRSRGVKADSNWKELRKSMPKSNIAKRWEKKRRVFDGRKGNGEEGDGESVKYSSFMRREVQNTKTATRAVAMDCEMVGVGPKGQQNALGRVSVVNYVGDILYDKFVKVREEVTDYRTQYSGIRAADVSVQSRDAVELYEAQVAVGELIKGRILIGHALKNDLRALKISHPRRDVRDTADFFKKVRRRRGQRNATAPSLRAVVAEVLGVDTFQKNEHDSCEDARAALALYKKQAKEWEADLRKGGKSGAKVVAPE